MQPATVLGLSFCLAYLIGDFPFQSFRIGKPGAKGWGAIAGQGLVHWVLVLLSTSVFARQYVNLSWQFTILACLYSILHLALDVGKRWLIDRGRMTDSTTAFVVNQGLHGAILVGFAAFTAGVDRQAFHRIVAISEGTRNLVLSGAVVYISVIFAGGHLIRYLTKGLVTDEKVSRLEPPQQLENAGLYIGWLERFLILTAVVLRSPTLIGLILTGKSIARFPELKETKFAEYFLIGTLLSFTLALFGGLLLLKIWKGTVSFQP